MRITSLIIMSVVVAAILTISRGASAIELNVHIGSTESVKDFGEYMKIFYQYFVTSIGILAAFMIMFGGYRWIVAAGNSQKIASAKDNIVSAVLGVVLALISWILLSLINPNIVDIKSVTQISELGREGSIVSSLWCKDISGMNPGECGKSYPIPEAPDRTCYGYTCVNPTQLCVKGSGDVSMPSCKTPDKACTDEKNEDLCDNIDQQLIADGVNDFACRHFYQEVGDDDCYYSQILECPEGFDRRNCQASDGGDAKPTPCYNSQPLGCLVTGKGMAMGIATCRDKDEVRAAQATDAICCTASIDYAELGKQHVSCADTADDSSIDMKQVKTYCEIWDEIAGPYKNQSENTCSKKCWADVYLAVRIGNKPFCENPWSY